MALQVLADVSSTFSIDLTMLSLLSWDFGSRSRLNSLYIDEAWLLNPFSIIKNCSELQPILEQLTAGTANSSDPEAASGFAGLVRNCADVSTKKMPSVRA